ncbi:MAG: tyrosine-type recombinase/integrase [Acidimicrobiales bacterium]
MAYIEIRVTGRPRASSSGTPKPKRVRAIFRNDRGGISEKNAFVADMADVQTKYDVRYKVNGRLASETFDTKREAEARATEVESAQDRGYAVDPAGGRMTVDELAEKWLASDPGKRGSTVGRDRSALRAHISPAIGKRQLCTIRQDHVQQLVNGWGEKLAPKTVDRTYGTLRAAFAYAVAAELIGRSPCHDVNLPKAVKRKRRVVGPDDVVKLSNAMDPRYAPMVWVGALLGLRWGEVAGLRIGSLDLLVRSLKVTETVTRDEHGRPTLGPPKSEAGIRTLAMPQVLVDILAGHLARGRLTGANADSFVFPAPGGAHWSYANYRRRIWEPATTKAGLAGVGFHDLRRTATTQLVLGNVDLKTAGTRLGHSDPRLTLAVYAQATSEADRAAADTVGDRFATAMGFGDLDRISTGAPKRRSAGA